MPLGLGANKLILGMCNPFYNPTEHPKHIFMCTVRLDKGLCNPNMNVFAPNHRAYASLLWDSNLATAKHLNKGQKFRLNLHFVTISPTHFQFTTADDFCPQNLKL